MNIPLVHKREMVLAALLVIGATVCYGETAERDQLEFANGLFHRGFHSEAIEEYSKYLEQTPDGPDAPLAWLRLGRSAIVIGQYDKALHAFQQSEGKAETMEQRMDAQVSQGEALFFLKRYADAAKVLVPATEGGVAPETRARALYYLGRARLESGDSAGALEAFNTLAEELPDTNPAPFAQYHLGFALLDAGNIEGAVNAFTGAANAPGADPTLRMESRFRAAELYDKLGWTDAALGAYEQLRTEFPDSDYTKRAEYGYAWALYHSARYDDALNRLEAFLTQYPDTPHAPGLEYLRGNCHYQQRRYEEALRVFEKLMATYADSPFAARALYKTAWAHHLSGATTAALDAVSAFVAKYADSELYGDAVYLLGVIRVTDGDYEEALKEFRLVAEKYTDSEFAADALFKSGECYAQLGLRNDAARAFEEFVRRYPGNTLAEEAMLRSGDARFTADDFAEALANYGKILEAPGDPRIEEETLYRMAVTYHNMKQFDDSAAFFRRLLETFPQGQYAVEAHFRIGDYELRQKQDPLKAIESYQASLQGDPNGLFAIRAKQGLAAARYEQKDYEQATAQLLQLLREHPDVPLSEDAYLWCGQWLREQERWADAATMYEAMLKAFPGHDETAGILFILGECREKEGADDKAIQTYTKALALAPDTQRTADIMYRLGTLHEARKETDKALAAFEEAANLDGGEVSARARFQLAAIQEAQGDHESAARNYMRLAILFVHETLSPEALWRAGNCYRSMGNEIQARSVFEELIADYPESPFAAQARTLLETTAPAGTAE